MATMASTNKKRIKQTRLSIEDRVKILERLDNGERATDLAREYKVSRSGITFIKKSKEYLLRQRQSLIMCQGKTTKKRCTGIENSPLEQALYEWFLERKSIGESVTGAMLQEKALELNKTLNGTNNFKGTNGFISKFKKRHNIGSHNTAVHGDKDFIEQSTINNFCQELMKYIMYNKIPLDRVYNAKETNLHWKTLPNRTGADSNSQISTEKLYEDRVTLMVCTNVTGSHKLSIFIVGKANTSCCLKNIRSLPFIYKEQTDASMDRELMLNWYHEIFLSEIERIHESNDEQCLLLLNNIPNYPSVEELNSINEQCQVINLPDASSRLQPMDQGIHENLKKIYRKHFLRVMLTAETSEEVQRLLRSLDIIKLCHLLHDAWDEVTGIVIRDSWKNIFPLNLEPELDPRSFLNMVIKIPEYNNITLDDVNSWLNSDNNEQESQILSNQDELLPVHNENNNDGEMNQECKEIEQDHEHLSDNESRDNVTSKSALDAIGTFLFWYQSQNQCSPQDFQYLQKFWKLALADILPAKDN